MCFTVSKTKPRRAAPVDRGEQEAEAAFLEAQAIFGHASAEALVARWYWQRIRNRNHTT